MRNIISFLRQAGRLKDTLRSAHTAQGRVESVAEHIWRLGLLAMTVQPLYPQLDFEKVLKLCLVHDLGEALHGDIPAVLQQDMPAKSEGERADFLQIMGDLSQEMQADFVALWDDYEYGLSDEARLVKGLDKLETLIQHNEGQNPEDFDYCFNLDYGRKYTDADPCLRALRALMDEETRVRALSATVQRP